MSARSQALVPLSTEQQAAWRAVAETEKRRHQGNMLAEYPYAGAFFRCLNGSRRISLSDLRFFMPSLTAKWHLNRSQFGIRIDHDLASISDHSLASQSITIWHASDH
ncbi:plasmid SOS inhibition protein A [Escherichia coli]|nr:plasmid SOS inhibition protein A [Escherichia coli]SQM26853.1 plasmid SOS inhibition protein A [Escherichia coli]